jgi:hypothetical protein
MTQALYAHMNNKKKCPLAPRPPSPELPAVRGIVSVSASQSWWHL